MTQVPDLSIPIIDLLQSPPHESSKSLRCNTEIGPGTIDQCAKAGANMIVSG